MSSVFVQDLAQPSEYKDHYYKGTDQEYRNEMQKTTTLYVGNLSFYTTEEQIYELFSKVGEIKRIIMGLDRLNKTPCGFAFIEYYNLQVAKYAKRLLDNLRLDERFIRVDLDPGFKDGRQFGRGKSGGQVRDEHRTDYDPARGGWGKLVELERERAKDQQDNYEAISSIPKGHHK